MLGIKEIKTLKLNSDIYKCPTSEKWDIQYYGNANTNYGL